MAAGAHAVNALTSKCVHSQTQRAVWTIRPVPMANAVSETLGNAAPQTANAIPNRASGCAHEIA